MSRKFKKPTARVRIAHAGVMFGSHAKGGNLVIKKWPRKRGKLNANTITAEQAAMRWAMSMSTKVDAITALNAKTLTEGTYYLPRDAIIRSMFGSLVEFVGPDGTIWRSRRELASETQNMLNSITTTPGSMLVRGVGGWYGLLPGNTDEVLTSPGGGNDPAWRPVSAPPTGGQPFLSPPELAGVSNSSAAGAFYGHTAEIRDSCTLYGITLAIGATGTYSFNACWAELNGTSVTPQIVDLDQTGDTTFTVHTVYQSIIFKFATPKVLTPGVTYFFGGVRTDGVGTDATFIGVIGNPWQRPQCPIDPNLFARMQTKAPAIGDTIDTNFGLQRIASIGYVWTP